jgi:hypothetical protein
MDVVVHQNPGIDRSPGLSDILTQALKKTGFVLVIFENY